MAARVGLPRRKQDVAGWAQRIRDERVNDTGRAIVDVLEQAVERFVVAKQSWEIAQLGKVCENLFRAMLQADRASEAAELAALRKRAEQMEGLAGRLRGLH